MAWYNKLREIIDEVTELKNDSIDGYVVFRGQANYSWLLKPSLYVTIENNNWGTQTAEENEYNMHFDFVTNAKGYINNNMSSWEIVFEMRHFGLPVRILDWTESLNAALYFAIVDSKINQDFSKRKEDASIYILDPFKLNKVESGESTIHNPINKDFIEFDKYFYDKETNKKYTFNFPFAVIAPRRSERVFAQKGLFTVQGLNGKCIDEISQLKPSYKKIRIEKKYFPEIAEYLGISGVNHFTIYPDFEGLTMYLKEQYKIR